MAELNSAELMCLLITAIAAYTDIRSHRIPNLLTVPAISAGILLNSTGLIAIGPIPALVGLGWKESISGAAVGFGLTLAVSLLSRGGGGDIKLATALGAFLGMRGIFVLLAATFISAAVCSISYFILRDGVFSALRLLTSQPPDPQNPRKGRVPIADNAGSVSIPMGPFFFIGTLLLVVM